MSGFTFRNQRRSYLTVTSKKRPAYPPITRNLLKIPSRLGEVPQSTTIEAKVLQVDISIMGSDMGDLQKVKEDLAAWLVTKDPEELIFDDEPDRIYYAYVSEGFDPEEIATIGKGTITFICPDSQKIGINERVVPFNSDGSVTTQISGTAEAFPILRATFNQQSTFFNVVVDNKEDYVLIGQPETVEQTLVHGWQDVLYLNGETMTGWANGTYVDGGVVGGNIVSDGKQYVVDGWGTGNEWHGPAKVIGLPRSLKNFRIDSIVNFGVNNPNQVGRVEIYLLDVNGAVIGKLALKDMHGYQSLVYGEARVGNFSYGKHIINSTGRRKGDWNEFSGILRIERYNDRWDAYIAQFNYETRKYERTVYGTTYYDTANSFSANLAQIQIHFGQWKAYTTPYRYGIDYIRVMEKNYTDSNDIADLIIKRGDELILDFEEGKVYLNGIRAMKHFTPGGRFFGLSPGIRTIGTSPQGIADVEMTYRPRWL